MTTKFTKSLGIEVGTGDRTQGLVGQVHSREVIPKVKFQLYKVLTRVIERVVG